MNTPRVLTLCVAGAAEEVAARIHAMLDDQRTRLDARWRPAHHGQAEGERERGKKSGDATA